MTDLARRNDVDHRIGEAMALHRAGRLREAIDLLTRANRASPDSELERALVGLRRDGGQHNPEAVAPEPRPPVGVAAPGESLFEVTPDQLDAEAVRTGWSRSGCVLVRGLISADRAARLAGGIDQAIAAFDAATAGDEGVDPGWYEPRSMPDRVEPGLPDAARRRLLRETGGLWTADSPHMLFELFELIDDVGIGAVMTDFLGERPMLSAIKGTLRRVPPEEVIGGWHQDGAFLGEDVGAFNIWLSLSECGRDAPGLDIVPRRVDRVVRSERENGAQFDWSLSDEAVLAAADGIPIARPEFHPGDALLFDHLLVHRTAASKEMVRDRYAIESWFFAPSSYPTRQLPILY